MSRPVPAPVAPTPSAAAGDLSGEDLSGWANSTLLQLGKQDEDIRGRSIFTLDGSYVPATDLYPPGDYHVFLSCAGKGRALATVTSYPAQANGGTAPDQTVQETRTTCSERPDMYLIDIDLNDDTLVRIEVEPDDAARNNAGFAFMVTTDPIPD